MKKIDVTILLLNDCYASTSLAPIEVFHAAGRLWNTLTNETSEPRFQVTVVSLDGAKVDTPYSIQISPEASIKDVVDTDIVVVPASGFDLDQQFIKHKAVFPWLQKWHAKGKFIASICSGAAYLAEAGLLDGREATTHWGTANAYMERYPNVKWRPDVFITEDQRILCSGGVYAAVDLSLYLVEKFCGHEIAVQTAKALLVDMPRINQSGYAVLPLSRHHDDKQIRYSENLIQESYTNGLSIKQLAIRANMSPRTFIRRFKDATGLQPGQYLQKLRVGIAKEMLEDGARSLQVVSSSVGYEDVAFFRSLFKRYTGMTPTQYRSKFGGVGRRDSGASSFERKIIRQAT